MTRYGKFVVFKSVEDHYRMGWLWAPGLEDTHHGRWAMLMVWVCDCPVPGGER